MGFLDVESTFRVNSNSRFFLMAATRKTWIENNSNDWKQSINNNLHYILRIILLIGWYALRETGIEGSNLNKIWTGIEGTNLNKIIYKGLQYLLFPRCEDASLLMSKTY